MLRPIASWLMAVYLYYYYMRFINKEKNLFFLSSMTFESGLVHQLPCRLSCNGDMVLPPAQA